VENGGLMVIIQVANGLDPFRNKAATRNQQPGRIVRLNEVASDESDV
jgi:hypothetical protein